jgi:hypothetical protein
VSSWVAGVSPRYESDQTVESRKTENQSFDQAKENRVGATAQRLGEETEKAG